MVNGTRTNDARPCGDGAPRVKVVVLGAGAVGAYYGAQLARVGHEVTFFARGDNLTAIRAHGMEVRAPSGAFHARVVATDNTEELAPADCAILGVKSYSLESIAPVVKRVAEQGTAILPFMNGVETSERLEAHGVPRSAMLGGVTQISVVRVQPGVVELRSPFQKIILGELDGRLTDRVQRIAAAFAEAGVNARSSTEIVVDLWQKFVFITTLAAACGLARTAIGYLRAQPLGRRLLERAAGEVVAVARARGVALPGDEVARLMTLIDGLPAGIKPSFLVDIENGRPTELDTLSGAVSRFAAALGIAAPIHDTATVALAER